MLMKILKFAFFKKNFAFLMYIPVRTDSIYSERLTAQLTSERRTTEYVENIFFSSHQWEEIDGINLFCCSICDQV